MGNPFVYDVIIEFSVNQDAVIFIRHGRGDVWSLMKNRLESLTGFLEGFQHHFKLFGGDIFIVQSLYDQSTALDLICMQAVVSASPEFRIVVKSAFQLLKAEFVVEGSNVIQLFFR